MARVRNYSDAAACIARLREFTLQKTKTTADLKMFGQRRPYRYTVYSKYTALPRPVLLALFPGANIMGPFPPTHIFIIGACDGLLKKHGEIAELGFRHHTAGNAVYNHTKVVRCSINILFELSTALSQQIEMQSIASVPPARRIENIAQVAEEFVARAYEEEQEHRIIDVTLTARKAALKKMKTAFGPVAIGDQRKGHQYWYNTAQD